MPRLARKDRISIRTQRRKVNGELCTMIEVEHTESGEIALRCMIGDDLNTERMADFLSAHRYPEAAAEVRRLVREARRPMVR